MQYLAGISQDENTLNNIVTVGSFLSGVAIILFIVVQVLPAWILLARSLQHEGVHQGSVDRYWQALLMVFEILVRGAQTRSVYKAARLRIEIELLNPAPERPRRLNHNSREEYRAARRAMDERAERMAKRYEKPPACACGRRRSRPVD